MQQAELVTSILCVAAKWAAVHGGFGDPRSQPTSAQDVCFRKFLWWSQIIVTFVIGAVRIGVLLFYKQVFAAKPRFNLAANVLVALCGAWIHIFVLLVVVKHFPVGDASGSLDPDGMQYHGGNFGAVWISMCASDILLGLMILALPLPALSSLQTARNRKIRAGASFCRGAFGYIGATVRLVHFIQVEPIYDMIYGDTYSNFSDSITNLIIWSIVEACFSIIAANLP
ncbi:FAD/NAD(P)-binding domain-containing protein [Apiospora saccharicola]